jgi:YbbR domain-containing protein
VLWGIAHGSSAIERGFDVPVVFHGVPEHLVITDKNADVVNVRIVGSRAALRTLDPRNMEYVVDVSGAHPGSFVHEVDDSRIEPPRGSTIVSRSPAVIEVDFERRGRKSVKVRPDLEGQPAEGYQVTGVEVEPPRVWLTGARSDVLRLTEVVTETVDITGLTEPTEREVRLSLGGGHVWMEDSKPVRVRILVAAPTPPAGEAAEVEEG